MSEEVRLGEEEAQDVLDALRFLFMGQKDVEKRAEIAEALIEMGPETDNDRGINLILAMLAEGLLKAEVAS